ncbi:alpha-tocopherol transfer protein-like [Trichogramma pretiosum]|uniref:alpha-tocopherol transfer protein-like n=1 Tax=Trichogramma pretiosum TaxID=7493 RepID=UPI0006C9576B|nr:alpha-tocopherol transfer protein-like [Trichogramma pretiosum]XP_023319026.1 alpha-tocopherol transfer protein-like [Trichogramma pretiosum]
MAMVLESCSTDEVCKALGGNDELLADLRSKLKDWLLHQPHLPQDMPEQRLEHFVISTKHSLELAKQKLDMYYTVRRLVPELFAERDPQAQYVTRLNESLQWVCLPKLTPEKYRVSILRSISEDPAKFQPWDFFKYTFMVGDIRISECRSLGDIYIYDLSAMRVGHLAKLTPAILKKAEVAATKAYGARIKGIHFINAPNFIDRIVTLVKSAIKPKLASRVHVHSSGLDSLYEHVPKSVLPADYGGEQASMNELDEKWRGKLADWRDWFLKEEVLNANEDLRPGPQLDYDDLFGFQGSFRKLEVD